MKKKTITMTAVEFSYFNFGALENSDFIAFLGKQPVHLEFGNKSNKILRLGKNLQKWDNTGLFGIGKQSIFGCKIGKIISLEIMVYHYGKVIPMLGYGQYPPEWAGRTFCKVI